MGGEPYYIDKLEVTDIGEIALLQIIFFTLVVIAGGGVTVAVTITLGVSQNLFTLNVNLGLLLTVAPLVTKAQIVAGV